jgi:hypothetical protein
VLPSQIEDDDDDLELRIAFDFDGVLADDESETVFKRNNDLDEFHAHEPCNMSRPHQPGPLAEPVPEAGDDAADGRTGPAPRPGYRRIVRIAIITARSAPAHERVVTTLKSWGVSADETFFLGGMEKSRVLSGVQAAHLFRRPADPPARPPGGTIPMVHVPFGIANPPNPVPASPCRTARLVDAYALALAALELKANKQMLTVIVANASDGQRLLDEIPWFADGKLRCHLLPDWETLPYDAFSPHQDLVSERLATLHEIRNGQCDVLLVPATTALVRMAPPSFLAAYTFFFRQGETWTKRAEGAADAGRLHPRVAGDVAGRILGARRPDRPVPDGLRPALPPRPVRRRDRNHPHLRRRHPALAVSGQGSAPAAGPRIPDGRSGAHRLPRPLARTLRRRPERSVVYKDIGSGIASAGIEYYLPLFFEETATLFDYLPDDTTLALVGDIDGAIQRFWRTPNRATNS